MTSLIYNLKRNDTNKLVYKTERDSQSFLAAGGWGRLLALI